MQHAAVKAKPDQAPIAFGNADEINGTAASKLAQGNAVNGGDLAWIGPQALFGVRAAAHSTTGVIR